MDASRIISRLSITGVALVGGSTPGALVALDGSGLIANSFFHPTLDITGVSGSFTVGSNLIVTGNLTVNGTTTTVHSETMTVDDNIIVLNSNVSSGTPTENGGIQVRRGSGTSASILWDESTDTWKWGLAGAEVALQPLDADLTSLAAAGGTNTLYYRSAADTWSAVTVSTGLSFVTGTLSSTGYATWGSITGTLSAQTDLDAVLVDKLNYNANIALTSGINLDIEGQLDLKAPIASPEFTGIAKLNDVELTTADDMESLYDDIAILLAEKAVGPVSAVDSNVVLFDGITGKLTKDGGTLGSAAYTDSAGYATAAQGAAADSALQPSGDGSSLSNVVHTEADPVVGAISGIVKSDGVGNIAAAVAGMDYSLTIGHVVTASSLTCITGTFDVNPGGPTGSLATITFTQGLVTATTTN